MMLLISKCLNFIADLLSFIHIPSTGADDVFVAVDKVSNLQSFLRCYLFIMMT